MKYLSLAAIGLLFCIQSCCYKKDCFDGDNITRVYLHGFGTFDDTVYFRSFEPHTNFSQKASDSFAIPARGDVGQSVFTAPLPKRLDITKDWIIDIGKVRQFKFKDAHTREEICTCNNYFTVLEYILDDKPKSGNTLELYK